jgi:hypothetical protein
MNLKNRIVATVAVAALVVPALAYAKHVKKGGKDAVSSIAIAAKADAGVSFDAKSGDANIIVSDNGTDTAVKIDVANLDTGMGGRNDHMKERVFKGKKVKDKDGKDKWVFPAGYQYVEVVVPNAAIAKGLSDKKIKAKLKMGGLPSDGIDIVIQEFSKDKDGKVHGKIVVTLQDLKLTEQQTCKEILGGVTKMCVKPTLTITADIYITEG